MTSPPRPASKGSSRQTPPRRGAEMARKAAIVIAMLLFAFPVMGADDSCSKEEATVEKEGGSSGGDVAQVGDKLTLKGTSYRVTNVKTAERVGDRYTGVTANGEF